MSNKSNQFRPTFTLHEIDTIILALKSQPENPEMAKVAKYLELYRFKATIGINRPSYTKQIKESVEVSLGFKETDSNEVRLRAIEYKNKIELKANVAPELMSPTERYDFLANKMIENTITMEEIEEGKRLEISVFGIELGTFVVDSNSNADSNTEHYPHKETQNEL